MVNIDENKLKAIENAMSQIEKQFGKGSVMKLGEYKAMEIEAIPTGSLSLDIALGIGGVPRGRIIEVYGPESSGKTTLALHVVAEAQKMGGEAAFIDAEHALDPVYAKKLGVDIDNLIVSQPDTGEQALEITESLVRSGALDVIVVDSVAALVPKAEIDGDMGDSHMGLQARLMSQALRKLTGTINKSKCVVIFINQLREKDEFDLIGVVSYEFDEKAPEAMYSNLTEVQDRADVIIDFSHPNNLDDILAYAKKNKTKVVFATTGFSKEQLDKIEEASKEIAIFQSYNTSFGIQMVTKILRQVAKEFYDNGYDIEILEKHHNQKIDAPSGTAKLLYEVMEDEIKETTPVYDRSALHEKRKKQEIGIQALRGGTIFGEHEIMFAGLDEIIEIKHTALSKDVFVQGALAAAKALQDKEAG